MSLLLDLQEQRLGRTLVQMSVSEGSSASWEWLRKDVSQLAGARLWMCKLRAPSHSLQFTVAVVQEQRSHDNWSGVQGLLVVFDLWPYSVSLSLQSFEEIIWLIWSDSKLNTRRTWCFPSETSERSQLERLDWSKDPRLPALKALWMEDFPEGQRPVGQFSSTSRAECLGGAQISS